jgi:hypothetical protein
MAKSNSSGQVQKSVNPWLGVLFFAAFTAFAVGMTGLATLVLVRAEQQEASPLLVLVVIFWLVVAFLLKLTLQLVVWAWRYGRSTLRLDTASLRPGEWVSGVVDAPGTIDPSIVQLSVDCEESFHGDPGVRRLRWQEVKLLDGRQLARDGDRMLIPFAVLLPADAEPSLHDKRKDFTRQWFLTVSADVPGVNYEVRFDLHVNAASAVPRAGSERPPRAMPELRSDQLRHRGEE